MARNYRHFVYDENQRFIYPTSDWGFKHLLGTEENKDLLIGILNELLPDLGIESLEFLPRDITIPVGKLKDASFDVYCKLKDGSRAVIEMQNYVRQTFMDRSLVYTSAAVLEHFVNSKSKGYKIGKTIFLAFLGDPLFKDVKRTPIRLSLCDIDEAETTLRNNKLLQIFVELPKFDGSLNSINKDTPFIEKLAHVLMEMADCKDIPDNLNDPILEALFAAADTSKMNTGMKDDYMRSIIGEVDYEYHLQDAKEEGLELGIEQGIEIGIEQGFEFGIEQGIKQGLEQGIEQGIEQGVEQGKKAEKERMASALKSKGIEVSLICELTDLTPEQIDAL